MAQNDYTEVRHCYECDNVMYNVVRGRAQLTFAIISCCETGYTRPPHQASTGTDREILRLDNVVYIHVKLLLLTLPHPAHTP